MAWGSGVGELAGAAADRAEQRALRIVGEPAAVDIGMQVGFEIVMAGHLVALAALLVQPHPKAPVLHVNVLDLHRERRADAREGIDHQADQGAVAQADWRRDVDASRSARASVGSSTGVLPTFTSASGRARDDGRIGRHDLAGHQPIEQMRIAARCCLAVGAAAASRVSCLDIGGDMQRLDVGDRGEAGARSHQAKKSPTAAA